METNKKPGGPIPPGITHYVEQNDNQRKDKPAELFPTVFDKCFFAIEDEFLPFEKSFLFNQIKRRSNINPKNYESLNRLGIEWLYWFLDHIFHDLGNCGKSLAVCIQAKLQSSIKNPRRVILDPIDRHRINQQLMKILIN